MKGWIVSAVILVAVLVGGYVWLERDPPQVPVEELDEDEPLLALDQHPEADGPEPARVGPLPQRVARLEREVSLLRREVARLRGARARSGEVAGSWEAALEDNGGPNDPFTARVQEIVTEDRVAEEERRMQLRRDRWVEFSETQLDELTEAVDLDEDQRHHITALWATEADRVLPLIKEGRDGERSFMEIREDIQAIREETDQEVKTRLSDEQYEKYLELRPRGPGGRRGPPPPE